MFHRSTLAVNLMLLSAGIYTGSAQTMSLVRPAEEFVARTPANSSLPTIYIVGDTTADYHIDLKHEDAASMQGWGIYLQAFLDAHSVNVVTANNGDISNRAFLTEGRWKQIQSRLKPGDIVLIQMSQGQTLPGVDDNTQEIEDASTHKRVTEHSYGWYLRQYIEQTKAKGATAIVLAPTPQNQWKNGHLTSNVEEMRNWARTVALAAKDASFVDVSDLMSIELEKLGQQNSAGLYYDTQTLRDSGAFLAAHCVISGLKGLLNAPVSRYLNSVGNMVPSADHLAIRWPQSNSLPTLWILGDSTVRNGNGTGIGGMWGWGDEIGNFLDRSKIQIGNVAISGRSSRTYYNFEWPLVLPSVHKGDIVLMQFGHNDKSEVHEPKRERGTLPGIGDETITIDNFITGKREVVHTYGWYVTQIVADIRSKGATPVLCSPIPMNNWKNGKLRREDPVEWSHALAQKLGITFIDLNQIIASQYEAWGKDQVTLLYADGYTHTSKEGALINAELLYRELNRVAPQLLKEYHGANAHLATQLAPQ